MKLIFLKQNTVPASESFLIKYWNLDIWVLKIKTFLLKQYVKDYDW